MFLAKTNIIVSIMTLKVAKQLTLNLYSGVVFTKLTRITHIMYLMCNNKRVVNFNTQK